MPLLGGHLRRTQATAVLIALCLALFTTSARATPAEELAQARASFLEGDFESAVGRYSALLYPTSRLAEASSIAEAHLFLGVSYLKTQQKESAKREFEEALFLDSTLRLDANLFSKDVVDFFDFTREEVERKAKAAAESDRLTRKQQALDEAIRNSVVLEKRRYFVNYVPFGAGQFQNGQNRKGIAFLASQTLTGGASIGLWSYQLIKYGFRGRVPRDEVSTVNTLQILQIGSGAIFLGLYVWGISDSLSNYEHTVTRKVDPSLIKVLEDIYDVKPTSSLKVFPILTGNSGGMSASWEF